MSGTLFVAATPLGNLEDLSTRALRILGAVACIASEDTLRTAKLLAHFSIRTRTLSCHRFNERQRLEPILALLREGSDVALVSDGGTPCVSDPGAILVRAVLAEGVPVSPVPGPSAVATLISASGFTADRFVFDGFLPPRAGERRRRLRELADERRTVVVYEAPHRIRPSLGDMAEVLGDRPLVLGRELTKRHETILRGTAAQILAALGAGEIKGEITIAIGRGDGVAASAFGEDRKTRVSRAWRAALKEAAGDRREALRRAARTLGMKRAELHRYLAELDE